MLAICSVAVLFMVACADDKPIGYGQLPVQAREFILTNFPEEKAALITKEREMGGLSYDVVFVSGTKLEFNRKGEWTEIECRRSEVDEKFIPQEVRTVVEGMYPGVTYIKIEKEDGKYEVKLSNGFELTFNKHFALIDIDD